MPRLSQTVEPEVTTEVEVEISPRLKKKVQVALNLYDDLLNQRDELNARIAVALSAIETPFHDSGETDALNSGVRVNDRPVKFITGQTTSTLNKEKLMKKFKLTPKNLDSVTDKNPKKPYLYVGPRKKEKK